MEIIWSNLTRLTGFPAEILVLALVLIATGKKNWRRAIITILAFILFRLAGEIIKEAVASPRICWREGVKTLIPCPDSFAFPSGHALGSAMIASIVSLIYRRKLILISAWAITFLIAVSRVAVGVHSPIDVVGGMIMGIAFGFAIWKFYWI